MNNKRLTSVPTLRLAVLFMVLQLAVRSVAVKLDPFLTGTYTLPAGTYPKDGATYDYIIVGGGAAGAVVAVRLVLAGESVLLVEAGEDPDLLSRIPAVAMGLLGSPLDWQYKTLPNNVSCLSSVGRQCRFSRGKCLGGSTSINFMLYTRGNRQDYDDYNIPEWSWQDLEPYFLRYEGLQVLDQLPASSKPYHNTCGIMKLEFFDDPKNSWQNRIIKGFKSLGFSFNADVNGVSQIGVTRTVGFVSDGERMGTARAYLADPRVKRKLKIAKSTYCTGILFDKKVAKGIKVVQGSKNKLLYARKEVILSAGTIETPKILMLSGIGPADHLAEMGIPLIADLPVGENMTDHVLPLLFILVDGDKSQLQELKKLVDLSGSAAEFLASRSGPLASNGLVDINVFANTSCPPGTANTECRCELPTLQVIHAYIERYLLTVGKSLFQNSFNLNDDVIGQLADMNSKKAMIVVSPVVLTPYSVGHIKLAGRDPHLNPAIFPNYLSDKRDVDEIMRSVRILEALVNTPTFRKENATIFHLKFPDCPSYEKGRDQYWSCYARHMTFSVFHAMGTCALGRCVDTRLRVYGVDRLRVADASVFPQVMRGNTAAPTIAVGERLVDFILNKTHSHSKC